jgi:hypothetical protein
MATVKVSYSGNTDLSRVRIDDHDVLIGDGTGEFEAQEGRDHALTCFVRGQPGSAYELKITAPASARLSRKATIDGSTTDAFLHWFRVDGGGQ